MNFENDEEFEQFLSEVEEDLKAYNQERADAGLSTLGTPLRQEQESLIKKLNY